MSFETERKNVYAGWQPIIEQLHADLLALDPDYTVEQIKEKFGGLRYYVSMNLVPNHDEAYRLIAEAEEKSETVCEFCGELGKPRSPNGRGWIKTTCDACHQARIDAGQR